MRAERAHDHQYMMQQKLNHDKVIATTWITPVDRARYEDAKNAKTLTSIYEMKLHENLHDVMVSIPVIVEGVYPVDLE